MFNIYHKNITEKIKQVLKKVFSYICSLSIVRFFFGLSCHFIFKCYQEFTYQNYKKIYDVHPTFKFVGDNIKIYGDNVKLGKESHIADHSRIVCFKGQKVVIGAFCRIGPNVALYTSNTYANQDFSKTAHRREGNIIIGDYTWIGYGVVIIEGVTIGKNCVIGANSVVTKNIPDYSIAAGNPIRIISKIKH